MKGMEKRAREIRVYSEKRSTGWGSLTPSSRLTRLGKLLRRWAARAPVALAALALLWMAAADTPGAGANSGTLTTLVSRNAPRNRFADSSWYPSIAYSTTNPYGHRQVVFSSLYSNLVDGKTDSNGEWDVFLARVTPYDGEITHPDNVNITLVSRDSGGDPANGASAFGAISRDGRYVVFQSSASNIARCPNFPADTNSRIDIYLFDTTSTGCLWQVSVTNDNSALGNNHSGNTSQYSAGSIFQFSYPPAALYVRSLGANPEIVFESIATNLTASAITPGKRNLYVRKGQAYSSSSAPNGQTVLLTRGFNPSTRIFDLAANGDSWSPVVSEDGRYLAFMSNASNLTPSASASGTNIYVMDRDADGDTIYDEFLEPGSVTVTLVSHKRDNKHFSCSPAFSNFPSISADGNFIAYSSTCSDLVEGDTNGVTDVFFYNRLTDVNDLVSKPYNYNPVTKLPLGDYPSFSPRLSRDGRWVTFTSYATNMVAGDTNTGNCPYFSPADTCPDIFVADLERPASPVIEHHIRAVSVNSSGEFSDNESGFPDISANAQYVAFQSKAKNLFSGYTPLPGDYNIYWRKWIDPAPPGRSAYMSVNTTFHKFQTDPNNTFEFILSNKGVSPLTQLAIFKNWEGTSFEACWDILNPDPDDPTNCLNRTALPGSSECYIPVWYNRSNNDCAPFMKTTIDIYANNDPFTDKLELNLEGGLPITIDVSPGEVVYGNIPPGTSKIEKIDIRNSTTPPQGKDPNLFRLDLYSLGITNPDGKYEIVTDPAAYVGLNPCWDASGYLKSLNPGVECSVKVKFSQSAPVYLVSNMLKIDSNDSLYSTLGVYLRGGADPAVMLPFLSK